MNLKKIPVLVLALALTLSLAACGQGKAESTPIPTPASPTIQPTAAPAADTVSFTDSCGRTVELPAAISRIAPSGPLAQMVLFALAPDAFVGLASNWSKEAKEYLATEYYNLPSLGQLYGSSAGELNLETLAAADPQVIIDIGEPKKSVVEDMDAITEQLGIPAVHIDAYTSTMGDTYRMLGQFLGREEEAEVLAKYCDDTYARINGILGQVGSDGKVKLLYCLGDTGTNVIANGSYHAEVIDLLSDNVAVVDNPSSKGTGNEVDLEQILLWDPDIIVFAPDSIYDSVASDPTWQQLKAIQSGNYCEVPFGPYNWMGFPPSVNRYLGMLWLTSQLYPQQADYDLYEEVARYYGLFYHCELTQAQFDALTAHALPS